MRAIDDPARLALAARIMRAALARRGENGRADQDPSGAGRRFIDHETVS